MFASDSKPRSLCGLAPDKSTLVVVKELGQFEAMLIAVELESAELLVVLLPAMGRVYRVVNKDTAHDVLWRNDIARPGGANNKLGYERAMKDFGLKSVVAIPYKRGQKDFSAEMLRVQNEKVDFLVSGAPGPRSGPSASSGPTAQLQL